MSVKILITGDYCPIGRNQKKIEDGDYTSFFGTFVEDIKKVDYAVTNLECPVTNNNAPILKPGPNIKGPLDAIKPLKKVGFNLATLANNHILDYGEKGVEDTIETCFKEKIDVVGAGSSISEARNFFVKKIKGKSFGFINLAENEYCAATEKSYGANIVNPIANYYDIVKAKKEVDYLLVIAHGGREHYQLPSPEVRERYRFYIDSGADVVVAHHTHCYSGYETYNNKNIFYSLGNFIFDYKPKYQKGSWTEGMYVVLTFSESGIDFELTPFFQGRVDNPSLQIMQGEDKKLFNTKIKALSQIIINDKIFFESWDNYIQSQIRSYNGILFLRNKYLRAAMIRKLVPFYNFMSKKRKALLLNIFRCETHKEIMIEVLKKEIKE